MAPLGPRSRVAAGEVSWFDTEPRLGSTGLRQVAQLARRASRRWLLVAALTALLAVLAGFRSISKPPEFSAEVILRIVESQEQQTPMSTEQVRDAIWDVAFSARRLLEVIRKMNLNPRWVDKDPSFAVDDLRDAINVTVWQNDLISGAKIRRAARVSISYKSGIRERVLPVTRALAELLVDSQGKARRAQLQAQVSSADEAVKRAMAHADAVRAAMASTPPGSAAAPPVGMAMGTLTAADDRLRSAQSLAVAAQHQLRQSAEGQELHFEEVDPGREPPLPRSKSVTMLLNVAIAALVAFPICLLLVGAFDRRCPRRRNTGPRHRSRRCRSPPAGRRAQTTQCIVLFSYEG